MRMVGGSTKGFRKSALVLLALMLLAVGTLGQDGPVDRLGRLVDKLFEVEAALGDEENLWRAQREHLETTIEFFEEEQKVLTERLSAVRDREDSTGAERARLASEIEEERARIEALDAVVQAAAGRLLEVYAGLPELHAHALAPGEARLRDVLALGENAADVLQKLRLLSGFSADLDRILGSARSGKQLVKVEGEPNREVDVLYLGAAIGYWVGPEDRQAGLLVRGPGGWLVERRDELSGAIREALAVLGKDRPPTLISLPIPGEKR